MAAPAGQGTPEPNLLFDLGCLQGVRCLSLYWEGQGGGASHQNKGARIVSLRNTRVAEGQRVPQPSL